MAFLAPGKDLAEELLACYLLVFIKVISDADVIVYSSRCTYSSDRGPFSLDAWSNGGPDADTPNANLRNNAIQIILQSSSIATDLISRLVPKLLSK